MFGMTKNILKKVEATKLFKNAIDEERKLWEDEDVGRTEEAQEEAIHQARLDDPGIDPASVPIEAGLPMFTISFSRFSVPYTHSHYQCDAGFHSYSFYSNKDKTQKNPPQLKITHPIHFPLAYQQFFFVLIPPPLEICQ